MTESQLTLVIGIGGSLLGVGLGFFLNLWNSNRIEKKQERIVKLKRHFEEIKRLLKGEIIPMARSLQLRNGRLVFDNGRLVYDSYDFEVIGTYKCFKLHFPGIEQEWKQLNAKAAQIGNDLGKISSESDYRYRELKTCFQDFAIRLSGLIENIDNYGIGSEFKKFKSCPICRDF